MTNVSVPTNQLTSETINTLLLNKSFELVHTLNSNEPPVIRITEIENAIEMYIDSEYLRCEATTARASTTRSLELLRQSEELRNLYDKHLRGPHDAAVWLPIFEEEQQAEEEYEECEAYYRQETEDYNEFMEYCILELEEERHYKSDYYISLEGYNPSEKELALAEAFNADIEALESTSGNKHRYNTNLTQIEKDELKYLVEMSWENERVAREEEERISTWWEFYRDSTSSLSDDEYLPF